MADPVFGPRGITEAFAISPSELPWRPLHDGVEKATVLKDPDRDFSAMLLRFAPGARAVRHVHPEGEQFYVISGTLVDDGERLEAGTFANRPPGSAHAPSSPDGALVLVTWFGNSFNKNNERTHVRVWGETNVSKQLQLRFRLQGASPSDGIDCDPDRASRNHNFV